MNQKSNTHIWLDRLVNAPLHRLLLGVVVATLIALVINNLGIAIKTAAYLSFTGTFLILMVQEFESAELKLEVIALSRQVEDLIDKKPVDQSQRGLATRLQSEKKNFGRDLFKSLGLIMLILGLILQIH